jgi:hypothetical protein
VLVLAPAVALALAGCGAQPAGPGTNAQATANGVAVTVGLRPGSGDRAELRATFSPQRPGFHLYSLDLPAEGIDGLGIPTRIAVSGGLTALAAPTTDRSTRLLRPTGLSTELPVYPDGPVTFTLPVRRTGAGSAEVVVSYGACSESTCLMPVTDEHIPLPVR